MWSEDKQNGFLKGMRVKNKDETLDTEKYLFKDFSKDEEINFAENKILMNKQCNLVISHYNKLRASYKEIYKDYQIKIGGKNTSRAHWLIEKCVIDYDIFYQSDNSSSDEEGTPNTYDTTHRENSKKIFNHQHPQEKKFIIDFSKYYFWIIQIF